MAHIEEIKDYWNLRANGFSNAVEEEMITESYKEWKNFFAETIGNDHARVLDDGTGPGFFVAILSGMGHEVTAIDYSDQMVMQAKKRLEQLGLKANVLQMDAQKLKFPEESFDAIVSRAVLWNLDDPGKAYEEMKRVLKPGGKIIIDDGNMYLYHHDKEYAEKRRKMMEEREKLSANDGGLHEKHNTDQVDFSIIERIAEDLPMSFRRRPQWDFDQLIRLGFQDIHITTRGGSLPFHFRIVAVKGEEL